MAVDTSEDCVYFIYRSEYEAPYGFRRVVFPEATVLDWFQKHWVTAQSELGKSILMAGDGGRDLPELDAYVSKLLKGYVSEFWRIVHLMPLSEPPRTAAELLLFLSQIRRYGEGALTASEHALEASTNDDEYELTWYLFDSNYARQHPERTGFLVMDQWELPLTASGLGWKPRERLRSRELTSGGDEGKGTTYAAFFTMDPNAPSDHDGFFKATGCRLPDFVQNLRLNCTPGNCLPTEIDWLLLAIATLPDSDLPTLLRQIANANQGLWSLPAITNHPESKWDVSESEARKCLLDAGQNAQPQQRQTIHFHAADHLLQVSIAHVDEGPKEAYIENHYVSWIFFDDLWAGQHPDLANSLLRLASSHRGGLLED